MLEAVTTVTKDFAYNQAKQADQLLAQGFDIGDQGLNTLQSSSCGTEYVNPLGLRVRERDRRERSGDRGGERSILFSKNRLKKADNEVRDKQIILGALANIDLGVVEEGIKKYKRAAELLFAYLNEVLETNEEDFL
ncbi:hypothetical protein Tco_0155511 [Tanacetum coccineum]